MERDRGIGAHRPVGVQIERIGQHHHRKILVGKARQLGLDAAGRAAVIDQPLAAVAVDDQARRVIDRLVN